jgi:hypothetical protein
MSWLSKVARDKRGTAGAEMALVAPLLLSLLLGAAELGNYFYDEHKLIKGVRDGARYAARQKFSNFSACSGSVPTSGTAGSVYENTKLMVRKGALDVNATDLLPNWGSATFSATMSCKTSLDDGAGGNLAFGGIYAATSAPTVVVTVSLPYRSIIGTAFGLSGFGLTLNATQSAAVMGL